MEMEEIGFWKSQKKEKNSCMLGHPVLWNIRLING